MTTLTIVINIVVKVLQVKHWNSIDWNLASVYPIKPVLILISSLIYTALSFLDKDNYTFKGSFWLHMSMGLLGVVYAIIMGVGVIITYVKAA